MSFQRKLVVVALASVLPMASVYAQSTADLKKEIEALKAQLEALQKKVEASSSVEANQKINRIEQRLDLADDESEAAGWKGLKFKGVAEASFVYDNAGNNNVFDARDGQPVGAAMLELTKETEGSEGVGFTLRMTPNNAGSALVHEASVQVPVDEGNRIVGGFVPDYQGYEAGFANLNPFVTHNALFDLAGPTAYSGIGMSNQLSDDLALKWIVGNIDGKTDDDNTTNSARSVGLAYRFDWTLSEYSYLGFSGAIAAANRNFQIFALDGGYTRGDWVMNGHLNFGSMERAAYNGGDAAWAGVSALVGYKFTPRLQLSVRADYLENTKNGGGTYVDNYLDNANAADATSGLPTVAGNGLGPMLDSTGAAILDAGGNTRGASLTRISLGSTYMVNPSTQWKLEYRLDQSTGNNFTVGGNPTTTKSTIGTSLVVSF